MPIHNLLLVFLCTCFRLHSFNRPIPFIRWEVLACKCFPWTGSWTFAQPPTWRTRWFFFRSFLLLAFTDSSVNCKAAVLVLVCPGYFISPVPSISGEHSPIRHRGIHPMGDQYLHTGNTYIYDLQKQCLGISNLAVLFVTCETQRLKLLQAIAWFL